MNRILIFASSLLLISCKSSASATNNTKINSKITQIQIEPKVKESKVITNYNNNKIDFSTATIRSSVHYSDGKENYNLSAEVKIKKDEQILISVRFLGITMAKASITPTSVQYYEKIGSTYFEGDFSTLGQWLGTDLNFTKVQNILLGRTIDDLGKGNYMESLIENSYKLEDQAVDKFKKTFYFDGTTFMLNKQEVAEPAKERKIEVNYSKNEIFKEGMFPMNMLINVLQPKGNTQIELEYNNMTFNEAISFPYSVPDGYKKIIIQ